MSIYYKYAPDGTNISVLFYVADYVYWYTSEAAEKWFVDALGNILHWFMSIRVSQIKDHYISVDDIRYATSIVTKYLDTDIFNKITKFLKTALSSDMIFNKDDVYTSDEQF